MQFTTAFIIALSSASAVSAVTMNKISYSEGGTEYGKTAKWSFVIDGQACAVYIKQKSDYPIQKPGGPDNCGKWLVQSGWDAGVGYNAGFTTFGARDTKTNKVWYTSIRDKDIRTVRSQEMNL